MQIERDDERLDVLVVLAQQLPPADFLRVIRASRVPVDTWGWRGGKLIDHFQHTFGSGLAHAPFGSAAELTATLRELGELDRPDCLVVLMRLVNSVIDFGGVTALMAIVRSVLEVSRWWP